MKAEIEKFLRENDYPNDGDRISADFDWFVSVLEKFQAQELEQLKGVYSELADEVKAHFDQAGYDEIGGELDDKPRIREALRNEI